MDCHRPLAFAMTNETKNSCLWIASSFHSSQWQRKQETVPSTSSLRLWNCHCETLQKEWESRYRDNRTQPTPSLRGLEKPVAISVWSTMTVKQNSSLREPKVRGNLSMGYNYLFMGFFLFSVFILTFCGLWGFASLCKGGSCEATGGLREKLKIEA